MQFLAKSYKLHCVIKKFIEIAHLHYISRCRKRLIKTFYNQKRIKTILPAALQFTEVFLKEIQKSSQLALNIRSSYGSGQIATVFQTGGLVFKSQSFQSKIFISKLSSIDCHRIENPMERTVNKISLSV